MKFFLLICSILISGANQVLASPLELRAQPNIPLVSLVDHIENGVTLRAPWFGYQIAMKNTGELPVTPVFAIIKVVSQEQVQESFSLAWNDVQIGPGATFLSEVHFIDGLHLSNLGTSYYVELTLYAELSTGEAFPAELAFSTH